MLERRSEDSNKWSNHNKTDALRIRENKKKLGWNISVSYQTMIAYTL